MEKRKAELIHKFGNGETVIETILMGNEDDVLIILTNKGVYKIDLTVRVTATVSAIRP